MCLFSAKVPARFLRWPALCFFCFSILSCSLFSGLRKKTFHFHDAGGAHALQLRVPTHYEKERVFTDSAGAKHKEYTYANGARLYFIYTTDTLAVFQPIDFAENIPRYHLYGGVLYKGLDSTGNFWREIRTDSFRFGYQHVPPAAEAIFDTAVNYAGMRRRKR